MSGTVSGAPDGFYDIHADVVGSLRPLPADFNDMDVLSAALALAAAGYFIFPTKGATGGEDPDAWKEPLPRSHWPTDSTRDLKQIVGCYAGTSGLGVAM